MAKILLVEDELDLAVTVRDWLAEESHQVEMASDGEAALTALKQRSFDIIILDWMLPSISGLEICNRYRQRGGEACVIMLTARRSLAEKEEAFELGADDYLTKPFQLRELSARIKAILRRLKLGNSHLEYGDIVLKRSAHQVERGGQELHLLPKEFAILSLLMQKPGKVYSLEEIIDDVWADTEVVHETVRSNIKSLRRKIDYPGRSSYITNVHGVGYKLEMPQQ
jgi:two-component system phosphate regulon response regulator PhoB